MGLLLVWLVHPEVESKKIGRLLKNCQRSLLDREVDGLGESLLPIADADMKNARVEYLACTFEQLICGYRSVTISFPRDEVNRRGSFQVELQIGVFRNRVLSVYEPMEHRPFNPGRL